MQQVARRDGNVLVWVGERAPEPTASFRPAAPIAASSLAAAPSAAPPALDSGERRQLTVMFCDLVGSTELAQRIDPEELREIVREYRAVCVEATKRFDGHVAQYLGDGVMVYFGYPQAHEDARTASAAEKKRLWPTMTAQWPDYDKYQAGTTRDIPVVVLSPR
jgi:class 3 adenylate cyclase